MKTLDPDLKSVLDPSIKIVNFIKSRPLQTRLYLPLSVIKWILP